MDINHVFLDAPAVLVELTREFVHRWGEEYKKDPKSQLTACFFLATRSASLLWGIGKLIADPETHDSSEVLSRGFLEARDLLLTFRFDHSGTREKIGYWFAGKVDNSWKAEHTKCEELMARIGHGGAEFGKRWSMTTTLAHPTMFASHNSITCVSSWAGSPPQVLDFRRKMQSKVADYLASIASLIIIATYEFPGLVSLECDLNRMPNIDSFRENAFAVSKPILDHIKAGDLPPGSYRDR
jgi:hypothetical protein